MGTQLIVCNVSNANIINYPEKNTKLGFSLATSTKTRDEYSCVLPFFMDVEYDEYKSVSINNEKSENILHIFIHYILNNYSVKISNYKETFFESNPSNIIDKDKDSFKSYLLNAFDVEVNITLSLGDFDFVLLPYIFFEDFYHKLPSIAFEKDTCYFNKNDIKQKILTKGVGDYFSLLKNIYVDYYHLHLENDVAEKEFQYAFFFSYALLKLNYPLVPNLDNYKNSVDNEVVVNQFKMLTDFFSNLE